MFPESYDVNNIATDSLLTEMEIVGMSKNHKCS